MYFRIKKINWQLKHLVEFHLILAFYSRLNGNHAMLQDPDFLLKIKVQNVFFDIVKRNII